MAKKILVTGGTGYIGSHTVVELQQAGYEVIIIDNLSNSNENVINGIVNITGIRPIFEKMDCTDRQALQSLFEKYPSIDGIIHFAASKAVGESVEKPLMYYRNNLDSLINLLELMPKHNVCGIVFSSSCTVYGEPDSNPIDENAPIKPATSPYGNTKQICEEIIQDFVHSGAPIKSVILRYFNPIGAHPSAEIGELPLGVPQNLVPFITQAGIGIREQLSVFGNDYDTPDGSCIRDFINVVDLAKAHVIAIERMLSCHSDKSQNPQNSIGVAGDPESGSGRNDVEIFNLGTGTGLSVLELIRVFEKISGKPLNYKIVGRREGDIEKIWAQPDKANNVLGWRTMESIEDTMVSAWKWQQKLRERGVM